MARRKGRRSQKEAEELPVEEKIEEAPAPAESESAVESAEEQPQEARPEDQAEAESSGEWAAADGGSAVVSEDGEHWEAPQPPESAQWQEPTPADEELADEPEEPKEAILPPVPSEAELLEAGFSPIKAGVILRHMKAMHAEFAELDAPPPRMATVPGLRISAKRAPGFWVCGHNVRVGSPWEVALRDLTEENRREIGIVKGKHISVEEIEVDVPLE